MAQKLGTNRGVTNQRMHCITRDNFQIKDSCPDATINGMFLNSRVSETSVRFQYQNFGFQGIVDDIELEVTCTINLCETTDCSTSLLAC